MLQVASIDGFIPSVVICQCTFSLLLLLFCYMTNKFLRIFSSISSLIPMKDDIVAKKWAKN